jgi:hypothetical protein
VGKSCEWVRDEDGFRTGCGRRLWSRRYTSDMDTVVFCGCGGRVAQRKEERVKRVKE